jgi:DNA primase
MTKIDYSSIDVEEFLNDLGMHNVSKDGKEIFFSCPFPGHNHGDLNPSASMQQGTTRVHCFGCGFNGNALTFLAEYENISPLKAAHHIRQYLGDAFKEPENSFLQEINEKLTSINEEERPKRNQSLDTKELEKREIDWQKVWQWEQKEPGLALAYMFDRGFHWQTLQDWDIGFDIISERITIPWFDGEGNLIGFKGRALDKDIGNGNARYLVLGGPEYGFDTFDMSLMFFGMDQLPYSNNQPLIIVEGELNAIALDQAGIYWRLGISGKHISDAQAYILNGMDRDIILWFDDVQDELKAADKLIKNNKVLIIPEHDKDPADSTPDEIRDLLSRAESAII